MEWVDARYTLPLEKTTQTAFGFQVLLPKIFSIFDVSVAVSGS